MRLEISAGAPTGRQDAPMIPISPEPSAVVAPSWSGELLLVIPILFCLGLVLFFFLDGGSAAAPDDAVAPVCRGSQLMPATC